MRAVVACVSAGGREVRAELDTFLSPDLRDAARVEANAWIKRLRLVPYGDRSLRARFTYRGDSLWWFTELYLHKERRLDAAVAAALAFDAARDLHAPARMIVESADPVVQAVALAFGRARGVDVDIRGAATPTRARGRESYMIGLAAQLSRLRPPRSPARRSARVAAFVHTAFWREGAVDGPEQESYIGPVLGALAARVGTDGIKYVGVGPRHNFRARRWWDPVTPSSTRPLVTPIERLSRRGDLRASMALWRSRQDLARALTSGDAIREAASFRGLDLWPVLRPELEGAALLQWPWSARAMDEAAAALDALQPAVMLTYAEAGGWGRALVLEARRRGITSIGLQHGFIYRHWLNYLHEADEMQPLDLDRGFPAPDRTLLFDGYASAWLRSAGHFAADRLVVTGNPGLDALRRRVSTLTDADRRETRSAVGAAADQKILLLAAKFTEARDTLPGLAAAVAARPGIRLVVKTHPAETPDLYAPVFTGVPNAAVMPSAFDLARLLAIADGLVTVNSTVAIDALTLGVPALVLGVPNNLSPFVAAGVMLGSAGADEIGGALEALLYDEGARSRWLASASRFTREHGMAGDGRAADRAVNEILA